MGRSSAKRLSSGTTHSDSPGQIGAPPIETGSEQQQNESQNDMTTNVPAPNLNTLSVSPALWQLLSSGPSENTTEIAQSPALKAEAARASDLLRAAAEPAGEQFLQRALAPLVLVFGLGEQASSPLFWKAYNDVLRDFPRVAIDRAVSQWQAEGKFFPKPAELRERAKPHADAFRQAAFRASEAQREHKAPEVSKRDQATPESRAQVARMLADFKATVEVKAPPRKRFKPVHGPVDDKGITSAGREIINRMRGYTA